jgi:hypothetical protein
MIEYFEVKDGVPLDGIRNLCPEILLVFAQYVAFCHGSHLPCIITNFTEVLEKSKSKTHGEGRAFDSRVSGWKSSEINDCVRFFDKKFGHLGAISAKDGIRRVCIAHDVGYGIHLHFQVGKDVILMK